MLLRVASQKVHNNPGARRNGRKLPHRPVTNQAHDLFISHSAGLLTGQLHGVGQQLSGHILQVPGGSLLAARIQKLTNIGVKLKGDLADLLAVAAQRSLAVLLNPLDQRLLKARGPAHERILNTHRISLREPVHHINLDAARQIGYQVLDDLTDFRLELPQAFGGEVFVVHGTERCVFGRIHTVWHGDVPSRDDIRVNFGMVEHMLHISVLEHGVAHELVVRYGAATAHLVISGHLVLLNLLAAQIPVIFLCVGHFFAPDSVVIFGSADRRMRATGVCREPARVCFGVVLSYLTVALNRLPRRIGVPLLPSSNI